MPVHMKKENDNKGFSLVELIIVIAIMAILVGALAPALIKYVRKSRRVADVDAANKIADIVQYSLLDDSNPNLFKIGADGSKIYTTAITWNCNEVNRMPTGDSSTWGYDEYIYHELGYVPVSKTNKNYYFDVSLDNEFLNVEGGTQSESNGAHDEYDRVDGNGSGATSVIRITLREYPRNDKAHFNKGKVYELYPNSSDFLSMND